MVQQTILVTGVFDLLHPGHVHLLVEIKRRYPHHQLVVGVNGDRRTAEIKERVLFSAAERKAIMEAIRYVDRVVVFEEDTPELLIRRLKPTVFVKGSDWAGKELPEARACAEVGTQIVFIGEKTHWSSELKRSLDAESF